MRKGISLCITFLHEINHTLYPLLELIKRLSQLEVVVLVDVLRWVAFLEGGSLRSRSGYASEAKKLGFDRNYALIMH